MSANQTLIHKADLALSDLASNGGLLLPEQSDTFIQTLMDSPTILNSSRVVTMNGPQKKINKIGFGSRILRPAVSATALAANDRSKPDLGQITLNTKEVIAEINLPYDVLEDNIEGGNVLAPMGSSAGGLQNTLITLMAERAALDLEELFINGDTASLDAYLAMMDGLLVKTGVHTVDALAAPLTKNIFKQAIKAMPDKYLRNRSAANFFVSVDNETEYRDTVANRATGLGDAALQTANAIAAFGSPIVAAPMLPNSKGFYTNPNNLIVGIQRNISMEFDKDIKARKFIIVLTARVDFQIEEPDAVVRIDNLG